MKETFAQYLKRVMQQKNVKTTALHKASGLSQSYIDRLLNGLKPNLTVDTIAALAKALDVDEFEVFAAAAAYGKEPEDKNVDLHILADTINKVILSPDLVALVQNTAQLKARHQQAVFEMASMLARNKANKKNSK